MAPLPAMARKRPVRVPRSAMPALIAPAMSRNTLSIAWRLFSLSTEASIVDSAPMKEPRPVTLAGHGVRLQPLAREHRDALAAAAADGELWQLWYTSVPRPEETERHTAPKPGGEPAGHMLPFAVREDARGAIGAWSRYH